MIAEIIVDSFAGGGGASIGIERATGWHVDIAINHDPGALALHERNHPHTRHLCESIHALDPVAVCDGRPVGLLWASPDCTHFSKAKGGKPRKKEIRGLAWVVVRWAAAVRPRVICLENVEEFQDWGPLTRSMRPCKLRKGATFQLWKSQLEALGYTVEYRVLRACDYGAPTSRKRLFLIARRDGEPIVWPEPTHGPGCPLPWRTAAECIDWSIPCPSIFERKRPLADKTLRRVARGLQRFVIDSADPFIVPIDNQTSGAVAHSIHEPLRTVTQENRFALVSPTLVQTGYGEREGQAPRAPGINKPLGTVVSGGGKHALVSAFLAKHYGGVTGHGVEQPIGTITGVDHHSVVTARLEGAAEIAAPHAEAVRAFMIKYYGVGTGSGLNDPMHTVTAKDRMALVTVMVQGTPYQIVDIGLRMLEPRELARAQGFPDSYVLFGTKKRQVSVIGNSVPPDVAEAIVRANYRPALAYQSELELASA